MSDEEVIRMGQKVTRPKKQHLIADYKALDDVVTCLCGATTTADGWQRHLVEATGRRPSV